MLPVVTAILFLSVEENNGHLYYINVQFHDVETDISFTNEIFEI